MNINIFFSHFIALLKRLALVLTLFSVTRLLFLLFTLTYFRPLEYTQIFKAFFFGFRFDFIVVFYINLVFILLHLFAFKNTGTPMFQKFLKYLFIVVNSVLLLGNFIDIGYFEFSRQRSGWELIDMLSDSTDTFGLLPVYISNYWYIFLMWLVSIIILIRFYPKLIMKNIKGFSNPMINKILTPVFACIVLAAGFVFARGLEVKPIRIISANKYVKPKYIPLLFNTPFKIINTVNQHAEGIGDFYSLEELTAIYTPVQKLHISGEISRKNVFIIILESFGKNYTEAKNEDGEIYASFLNSLASEGLQCTKAYANAGNSISALPTIIGGFPSFLKTSFVSSAYSTNIIRGLGAILKDEGYQTAFFHGGLNGTMAFDKFCQMAGIDLYFGRSEFDNDDYFDGSWGIFDEEFFKFTAEKVNLFEKPFFAVLFSLSSHDPYPIPERYSDKFFPGDKKVLRSIAYTDYSLRKFFETAKKMDWFDNTLFVICPDHISTLLKEEPYLIKNRIPIVYYCHSDTMLRGAYENITQQLDIYPSILDYLGYSKYFTSFGKSIFSDEYFFTVCKAGVNFQIIDSSLYMDFDGEKALQMQYHKNDSLFGVNLLKRETDIQNNLEMTTKAYLQNYFYRLNNNLLADTLYLNSLPPVME